MKISKFVNYELQELALKLHDQFINSKPFNHIILDDLFDNFLLENIDKKFPKKNDKIWWEYDNQLEKKLAFNSIDDLDEIYTKFFEFVNSSNFIIFLQKLSGLTNLISDKGLNGGGLHQILKGGKLDIHEDFNVNKDLDAFRKLNLIVYLNKSWKEEYGGHLEMWNQDMTLCEKKILPIFGRVVIFRTDQTSNHGHPLPLSCPEDMSRKSLAVYYYEPVNGRNYEYRSTFYKKLPEDPEDPELDNLRKVRLAGRLENKKTK